MVKLAKHAATCGGGHGCCDARFYIRANTINLVDEINPAKNTVSLNNTGCNYYVGSFNFKDDYNYPPIEFSTSTWDRYDVMTIGTSQAVAISNTTTDGFIEFSLVCASPPGYTCHDGVTWMIFKLGSTVIYEGCPIGNFLNLNPCTGEVKPKTN